MKIYLDNNATTPFLPEVKKKIESFLEDFGNPSSLHKHGREAAAEFWKARRSIAHFFGTASDEDIEKANPKSSTLNLIFTAGGSEADNMVLKSVLFQNYPFKPHVITSEIEHPAVLETARFLESQGVDVTYLKVDSKGLVSPEDFEKAIRKETVLASIMYANNEIGTIQPIQEIGTLCKKNDIIFHTDAVQAAGKIAFKLKDLPIDFASLSAHKIYAPKGTGALYMRNDKKLKKWLIPLIHGGHQENGYRAGTENLLGIIAMGTACDVLNRELIKEIEQVKDVRDYFEQQVKASIENIIIHGENSPRLPSTSNIAFQKIEGESILLRLDFAGVAVSTGSACATGSLDPSHVIMAVSHKPEIAHGSIRFSFGRENTRDDVDYVVNILKQQINLLRMMSPF